MRRYDLGIVGGLGPLAGAYFATRLTELEDASCDQDHLTSVLIQATKTPDRTEALLEGGADPIPSLSRAVQDLIDLGCASYCIICNTAHAFVPRLSYQGSIRFLSLIDSAKSEAFKKTRDVYVLSTEGTKEARVYEASPLPDGCTLSYPDHSLRRDVTSVIQNTKSCGITNDALKLLASVVMRLHASSPSSGFILACTELSCYRAKLEEITPGVAITDALDALAREAIRACGHRIKES